jgi:putative transposase
MWRGHNREYVLDDNVNKVAYLDKLFRTYSEEIEEAVSLHAFCLMGNHVHEVGAIQQKQKEEYQHGIKVFGNWMRNAHSQFGAYYNNKNNRQGKVAYDRPKTSEIEDQRHLLQVMFYLDANPVRAGIVSHPKHYRFSSYSYYAHGKKNHYTRHLTQPDAYLALGKNTKARQRKYRKLCDRYLRQTGLIDDAEEQMLKRFIGNPEWIKERASQVSSTANIARNEPP